MRRILVVYFSRDGHTRRIAREIAVATGGALEEIRERGDRQGPFGYLRSALESLLGVEPPLSPARRRAAEADLVVIGTPIWFWNIASPVRAWLTAHRGELPRVAFFCTCGGSGQDKVFHDMAELIGREPIATMGLTQREAAKGAHGEALARFVKALSGAPAARRPAKRTPAVHRPA